MSEQISPERQAEADQIGRAAYQAMRAEMIKAGRQRDEQVTDDIALLLEALEVEAAYQAAREARTKTAAERRAVLYAMWRKNKDPRAVAALLPKTVTAATVRDAVIKLAPSQDFETLPLWRTYEETTDDAN